MKYIDLEDAQPETEGHYTVKIEGGAGERESKAQWKHGEGFTLLKDTLAPEEYITQWQPNGWNVPVVFWP